MRILALDLATKTGWALWDGARMESGVQDFTKQRGESNGMLFLKFNRWLHCIGCYNQGLTSITANVDLVVFEQAHHRGGAATEIAVGLMTRVLEFCARYGIEHSSVHSMTLKKWATGKGNADKELMKVAAALRRHQISGAPAMKAIVQAMAALMDDNEADAILLLGYAMEKFGGGTTSWNAQPATRGKTELPKPSIPTA